MNEQDLSDHDVLVKIDNDLCWVKKMLENHLKHHFLITLTSLSAALSAIVAILLVLLKGK